MHVLVRAATGRAPDPRVLASVVLAGWVLLDARWQLDLWRQLGLTRERYAGKSWLEKRLAAEDTALFRFALDVKARLPPSPQVVYLLASEPDAADRYLQLRLRYHLLPHNVCTYYSVPPNELLPSEVPVERILAGGLGTVYRRR
jgi:hypothetical protein